jgi:hypothetical protein
MAVNQINRAGDAVRAVVMPVNWVRYLLAAGQLQ